MTKQMKIWLLRVILLVGVSLSVLSLQNNHTQAAQTIPYKINFQGRLTDNNGNILADGLYNIKFRFYSVATGGSNVWEEYRQTTNRVQVTQGLFNVQLGDVTAISASLFNTYPMYLEVELPTPATATCATAACASFTEGALTPRQPVGSTPYAFNADQIDGIDGVSLARVDQANVFTGLATLNGGLTVETGDTFTFNSDAFTDLTGTGLQIASGSLQTTLGTSIDKTELVNSGTLAFTWSDAEVANTLTASIFAGTGSTSNAVDLASAEVAGTLGVTNGGSGTNTQFTQGSIIFAGASGVYSQNNSNLFWDNSNGRLGLGTASPGSRLSVTETITATSSNNYSISVSTTAAPSSAPSTALTVAALRGFSSASGANVNANTTVVGSFGGAGNASTATLGKAISMFGQIFSANDITDAYNFRTQTVNSGNGTFGSTYGLEVQSPAFIGAGSITNAYGVYLASQDVTGVGTGYGIYQAGAADINYLGGTLGVDGLTTLNGGLTLQTGDNFIINGDTFTDLTGTGLTVSSGALQSTLGVLVDKSELENSGTLAFTWSDAEVANTLTASIFVGSGSTTNAIDLGTAEVTGTLLDANLSANVSLLGSAVSGNEISDNTIEEVDLEATNAPTNGYVLSYDSASGGFTWVANSGSSLTENDVENYIFDTDNAVGSTLLTGSSNGIDMLTLKRNTDTTPTGSFVQLQNATGANLFAININGQVQGSNGSISAPTYSFANETNTGIYLSATNNLDFAVNGSSALSLNNTYMISSRKLAFLTTGNAASPLILPNGLDLDTGIYQTSGDSLGVSTGGTERLSIANTGATITGVTAINASANNTTLLTLKRQTDTAPTGNFVTLQNAASASLFNIDITGAITAATGMTSSGNITFSGLTATRALGTTTGGQLTTTFTSAALASSLSNETGSGVTVFGTSPAFTTSVTTASTTFALFNTGATTLNAFGVATTMTMGGSGGTMTLGNGGAFTIQGSSNVALNIKSQGTGALNIGDSGAANTIQIGNTTGAVAQTINIGNNATASSTSNVNLGSTIGSSATTVQSGSGNLVLNAGNSGQLDLQAGGTNYLTVGSSGTVGIGNTGADSASGAWALRVNRTYDSSNNCGFGCYGGEFISTIDNTASNVLGVGLTARVATSATSFTLDGAQAIRVLNPNLGSGSTITNNYGVFVTSQTAGTNDYGMYIQGADTAALYVESGSSVFGGNIIVKDGGLNALGDQESMVPNSGFEVNDDTNTSVPDSWADDVTGGGSTGISTFGLFVNQGERALALTATTINDTPKVYSSCIPVSVARAYNLSVKARASVATNSALTLDLVTYGSKSNCTSLTSGTTVNAVTNANLTTSYVNHTGTPTAGGGSRWARVFITLDTPATVATAYIDGLRMNPSTTTDGVDIAENFPVPEGSNLVPGEIVSHGGKAEAGDSYAIRSEGAYDSKVFGVVSTQPGLTLDDGFEYDRVAVALAGRVPVRVNNENGPINVGDPIAASSVSGIGMRASIGSQIIGYATQDFNSSEGTMIVFVNPGYWSPPLGDTVQQATSELKSQIDNLLGLVNSGNFGQLNISGHSILASLTVTGNVSVQGKLTVVDVVVTGDIAVNGHIISSSKAPEVEKLVAAGKLAEVSVDGTDMAGTLTIKVKAGSENGVEEALNKGELLALIFNKAYEATPRVTITPVSEDAVNAPVYVTRTNDGFKLIITAAAENGKEYKFDYIVIGSEGVAAN